MTELLLSGKGSNYSRPNFPATFSAMQNPRIIGAIAATGLVLSLSACTLASSMIPGLGNPEPEYVSLDHVSLSVVLPSVEEVETHFNDELVDIGISGDSTRSTVENRDSVKAAALSLDDPSGCVDSGVELVSVIPDAAYDMSFHDVTVPGNGYALFSAWRYDSAATASDRNEKLVANITACEEFDQESEVFRPMGLYESSTPGAIGLYDEYGWSVVYQRGNLILRSVSDVSSVRADEGLELLLERLAVVEAQYDTGS